MAKEEFQFTTVTRTFAEGVELAETPTFPEVSALADSERHWRSSLQAKLKTLLEDADVCPALQLYRRRASGDFEIDSITIVFDPPRRSPDWQEPVQLQLPFVHWSEADDLHHAYLPALKLQVFASRASQLKERLEAHVRLVLVGGRKKLTLNDLTPFAQVTTLRTDKIEVTANRKSLVQLASTSITKPEGPSVLDKIAEELPPHLPRAKSNTEENQSDKKDSTPPPQAVFELEKELQTLAEALTGPYKRSVLLVGSAGCGKTALVRELARRRRDFGFAHTPFWSTCGARLMTGPIGFGMWQERCQEMTREAARTHSILHLGNLGELLEVGKTNRTEQSVGSFLRPAIARGEMLTIAECTPEQISVIERQEPHLLAAFQQLSVAERTPEQLRSILNSVFEIAPGKPPAQRNLVELALDRILQLHARYATYSANPARPIRFLKNLLADRMPEKLFAESEVTLSFSKETGLPAILLDDRLTLDLPTTGDWFAKRVIGQPEAIDHLLDLLALIKTRLSRPGKPLASFLFIGPTGTGKTEMAKALAEFLFGSATRMTRFDLNEFSDPLSIQRLIGGPATGGTEGLLTARVREQPFSVLLLDEFEKADSSFFDLLLQILGDGRLTDAAGRVADFSNTVIVMTSNLGAQGFQRGPGGFRADGKTAPDAQAHFTEAVQKFLRPEIFNRLDSVVPFRPLSPDIVLAIAHRQLDLIRLRDGIRLRPLKLNIHDSVALHLAKTGYDVRYGARPLKRAVERELLIPLAEALNAYAEDLPLSSDLNVIDEKIKVQVRAAADPEKTDSAGLTASSVSANLAQALMSERRFIARLQNCSATSSLENQVTLIESLTKKLAKWKTAEQQARVDRLPKLRECLSSISALHDKARNIETEALSSLYQKQNLEYSLYTPEIDLLRSERKRLMRDLFRFLLENPNDVIFAIYSEHQPTLFQFASAYYQLAARLGKVVALDYFTPPTSGRTSSSKPLRQTPKEQEKFFASPPEKVIGIVMQFTGDLFLARFKDEAGFHCLKNKNSEFKCLVETGSESFAAYEPPNGIERQGTIDAQNVPACRRFYSEKKMVEDSRLDERPWLKTSLEDTLNQLLQERLNLAIESVIN